LAAPSYHDLLALRLAGKKVVFNFRGTEARAPSIFKELSPYSYVAENPNRIFDKWTDRRILKSIELVKTVANKVLVTDPEIQSYINGGEIVPRSIDTDLWRPARRAKQTKHRPLIIHAPSKRAIKGTASVLNCIASLKAEGYDFDFKLVEGLSNNSAKELYTEADIVIDQLRIGWYGVLAVECMALGKTVLAYIRDDLIDTLGETPPLVPTTPTSLAADLRQLLDNKEQISVIGHLAREFTLKVHDSEIVNKAYIQHYDDAMQDRSVPDAGVILDFFNSQADEALSVNSALLKKIKRVTRYQATWRFLIVQVLQKMKLLYPIKRLLGRG
jgi:glycosyltransferase involved in cell wall biosynthesis